MLPRMFLALTFLLAALTAQALAAGPPAPDLTVAQEARAKALFKELRCMVCQGETLADSEADLARDLKALIRSKIAAGESDAAIKVHLVRIYGETILLSPPLSSGTWLLWFGPVILLAGACIAAWFTLQARSKPSLEPPLSAGEADEIARGSSK